MPASTLLQTLGSPGGQVGAGLVSEGLGAFTQGLQNRANRRHAEKMFQWEVDANRENWRMQNEYNSPEQQMRRLKEAGLNPNLVYGNGATATGGSISSASASSPQGQAPRFNLQGVVSGFLDAEMKQVQINNAKEVNKNLITDGLLKEAQVRQINQKIIDNTWDLSRRQGLAPYQMESLKKAIDSQIANIQNTNTRTQVMNIQIPQIKAQTQSIIDDNARKAQMQPYNIRKIVADTGTQIQNRLKLEYYNKNINSLQKDLIQQQIENIRQGIIKSEVDTEYKKELKYLQEMINQGMDPRAVTEIFKGLFQRMFKF